MIPATDVTLVAENAIVYLAQVTVSILASLYVALRHGVSLAAIRHIIRFRKVE